MLPGSPIRETDGQYNNSKDQRTYCDIPSPTWETCCSLLICFELQFQEQDISFWDYHHQFRDSSEGVL